MYNLYAYTWGDLLRLATDIPWVRPNSCNSKKKSLYFGRTLFWMFSFVPKFVLFGALLRATNRAFWCSPSWQKSCSRSCSLLQLLGLCQDIPIIGGYPKTILDGCIHCSSYKMNASRHFLPQLCMDYVPAVWWLYHCYNTISSFPHSYSTIPIEMPWNPIETLVCQYPHCYYIPMMIIIIIIIVISHGSLLYPHCFTTVPIKHPREIPVWTPYPYPIIFLLLYHYPHRILPFLHDYIIISSLYNYPLKKI